VDETDVVDIVTGALDDEGGSGNGGVDVALNTPIREPMKPSLAAPTFSLAAIVLPSDVVSVRTFPAAAVSIMEFCLLDPLFFFEFVNVNSFIALTSSSTSDVGALIFTSVLKSFLLG
jgi:hypothetical protein